MQVRYTGTRRSLGGTVPGYTKDLRNRRTQPYKGPNPIQARWRNRNDPADRQEKSHPTVGAARQWIAEQDADAERGVRVDSRLGRATIEAIARDWMEANRLRTGPKTREGYVSILNQH